MRDTRQGRLMNALMISELPSRMRIAMECAVCWVPISKQNFTRVGERAIQKSVCSRPIPMFAMTQLMSMQASWTFQSALGARRKWDYCIAAFGVRTVLAEAVSSLDLSSDHRAIQACLVLPSASWIRHGGRRGRRKIDWGKYREQSTTFDTASTHPIGQLEASVADVAYNQCLVESTSKSRPWDKEELQI